MSHPENEPTTYGTELPNGRWTHNPETLLLHFLATETVRKPGAELPARKVRTAYERWAAAHGEKAMTLTQFGRQVAKAGIAKRKSNGRIIYVDIAPKGDA